MGYIYIGAIGLITTYFFHGRENAANLVQNCTNCGACQAVCAAGIELPKLIKEVHQRIQDETGHPMKSLLLGKVLKNRKLFHTLLRTASLAQKPVTGGTPYLRHLPLIFSKEHNFRAIPAIADSPFRDRWKKLRPQVEKPDITIALFSGCVQDFVYPEQLEAGLRAMKPYNVAVDFPMSQSCCGLPAMMMGEKDAARDVAVQNVMAFKESKADYIVTLCASCASHLKHAVPDLAGDIAGDAAREFADKVLPFSVFMNQILGASKTKKHPSGKTAAWHSPCHLCRGLGVREDPRLLLEGSEYTYVQCNEEETCCGFGGSFSANFPSVSKEILATKLKDVMATGADVLVTECPGCVMQLRGGAVKNACDIRVVHLSEILDTDSGKPE